MKRMLLWTSAGLMAVALGAQLSHAQGGPPMMHGFPGGGPGPMGMGPHPAKIVTGEPYSADVSTAVNETLADGNTINRTTTGHVARDSQGRTYSEQDFAGGPWAEKGSSTMIFLLDPVAGYSYVLNPNTKVAMRRALRTPPPGDAAPDGPRHGVGHPPADANDKAVADLGSQNVSGIQATGKSVTRTIPAGTIGNAQPIIEKSEIWTSADLQVVVLSKHTDPRFGQSTYTLSNIRRGDPSASLFQVPSDYTVKDAPSHGPR